MDDKFIHDMKIRYKIGEEVTSDIKSMINDFLKYIDSMGYELDKNGDIVPKSSSNHTLHKRNNKILKKEER